MKDVMKVAIFVLVAAMPARANFGGNVNKQKANPVQKVLELLSSLEAKVIKEGENSQKVYDDFSEWCEEESKNLQYAIKTAKGDIEDLQASITKESSTIDAMSGKIEELSGAIAQDDADLKAATEIRDKENAIFVADERELLDAVDMLGRAITILERELAKGSASFLQTKAGQKGLTAAQQLAQALSALVDASAFSAKDASKLTAFIQSHQEAEDADNDDMMGAPDPAAYKSHSGGIVEILEGMLEKAEDELAEARKKEAASQHNFDLLKLSIEDELKVSKKEFAETEKIKSDAAQIKAEAEGDLAVTSKGLAEDMQSLSGMHTECMAKAQEFEAEVAERAEELKALAQAKKIISEMSTGAGGITYDLEQTSFLQISFVNALKTREDLSNFEAVTIVRNLARKMQSEALNQLANRMANMLRFGSGDVFAKVKSMIGDMIEALLKEAEDEAAQKGYCDKEMAESKTKKADLESDIADLKTKLDMMTSKSAKLKEEVATLQKELAELAKSQAEMNKIRQEEKTKYDADKKEMDQGLEGIKMALKVLRDYYGGGGGAQGASTGIIGMLEVIESDFSKGIAEMNTAEENAIEIYEKTTKENEISKSLKEQDVKYKTKEAKGLDKSVAEAESDKEGLETELDTVMEYYNKLKPACIAQPETYEERKKRREAEIAGLKEALSILEGEAVFFQQKTKTHFKKQVKQSTKTLRGGH